MVPNRRGLWARMDTTPFGHGRPYSRSQINQLLRETWFTPTGWSEALYVPPIARGWFLRSAVAWERTGATLSAPFAGVHLVEATKQVYRAIPARRVKRRLVPALEPALAPSPGLRYARPRGSGDPVQVKDLIPAYAGMTECASLFRLRGGSSPPSPGIGCGAAPCGLALPKLSGRSGR